MEGGRRTLKAVVRFRERRLRRGSLTAPAGGADIIRTRTCAPALTAIAVASVAWAGPVSGAGEGAGATRLDACRATLRHARAALSGQTACAVTDWRTSWHDPWVVRKAMSAASRPQAIRTRPSTGARPVGSTSHQPFDSQTSKMA